MLIHALKMKTHLILEELQKRKGFKNSGLTVLQHEFTDFEHQEIKCTKRESSNVIVMMTLLK